MNSADVELGIEVRDLRVQRGDVEILHGISCNIPRGSITGLLGPSGCGKTTLMRSIVGVQHVTSGSLRVLGLPAGVKALRHRVGYTSQSVSIYPDISVRANVRYFGQLIGASREDIDMAIERVELSDYADRHVGQLSGGQAGRASLACALVGRPAVLILDEPTVGLDPLTREELWTTFRSLAASDTTLLISSHVMDEAVRCDSVLLMRDGRFLAHEPMAEIQRRTGTTNPEAAFLALVKQSDAKEEA